MIQSLLIANRGRQILPGTGRETATRSGVVEGARRRGLRRGWDPSVRPSACHLPVPGRIW
jgi:hypothetical protein